MKCKEVFDNLGDAIDRELPKAKKDDFYHHLEICPPCRNKFELECLAKSIIRKTLRMVRTPRSIYSSIVRSIREESGVGTSWLDRLLGSKFLTPVLVGGLAIVAVMFFLSEPQQAPDDGVTLTPANDIISQSMANFSLIREGSLKPALTACDPDSILQYFKASGVPFSASIVRLSDCDWYGAIVNQYNGVRLAHVVYKMGNELMYVYQVSKAEVMEGSVLTLPQAAKSSLTQSGWYTDPDHPEGHLVLWSDDGSVCSAVSTMEKQKMLALLKSR